MTGLMWWMVGHRSTWSDSSQVFVLIASKEERPDGIHKQTRWRTGHSVSFSVSVTAVAHTPLPVSLCDASLAATLQISHELFIDGHGSQPADFARSLWGWMTPVSSPPTVQSDQSTHQHRGSFISSSWKVSPQFLTYTYTMFFGVSEHGTFQKFRT